jgi:uncharacterized peroxidase-related enzyme
MSHPISKYPVPKLEDLPQDIRARMLEVQQKAGFIPNVFLTLAHRPDEVRAFFSYHDALMLKDSGLSKSEKEMIVVATSGLNRCPYCVIAHGAILRVYAKNPQIADQVAIDHCKADITSRQKAMLDFACKLARTPRPWTKATTGASQPWIQRRGHLGHRCHIRVVRALQPHGAFDRHARQRRVLLARARCAIRQISSRSAFPARILQGLPVI